ncbi:MAG TPA: hypothetical protein VI757_11190 [Bacteroidia bacterium]|nr:hypothetical protein [Bacteroidia bacterium]
MAVYDSTQTISNALDIYFTKENLGKDGGLDKRWAKIKVGKIYLPLPNTKARKKALVFHDIHHIVTGYDGDWKGEASIGAWEVASGCAKYYVAWVLNLWAMAVGLFIYPKHVLRAFVRGMRTQNLYHHSVPKEEALKMKVSELQKNLLLDKDMNTKITTGELFSFLLWSAVAVISAVIPPVLLYIILRYCVSLL